MLQRFGLPGRILRGARQAATLLLIAIALLYAQHYLANSAVQQGGSQRANQAAVERDATAEISRLGSLSTPSPSGTPAIPTNLQASPQDSGSIRLDWFPADASATGFAIYDGLTQTQIATAPAGASTLTLRGLTPDTDYCVYLYAINAVGFSDPTDEVCATTPN